MAKLHRYTKLYEKILEEKDTDNIKELKMKYYCVKYKE